MINVYSKTGMTCVVDITTFEVDFTTQIYLIDPYAVNEHKLLNA